MWRARPLSDTAPPKAVPLTHGEARGGVTRAEGGDGGPRLGERRLEPGRALTL